MLYIGEKVGIGVQEIDIALDPLEGTTILATGGANSLTVLAFAEKGGFLHAPDVYMDKIAIGFAYPENLIDLDNTPIENLKNISLAKGCDISQLLVVILNRPRHEELIAKVREAGARVRLINDGDIAAVIATTTPACGVDVYMGIGGAPEGVLAAAALRTMNGQIQGRLLFNNKDEEARALKMGILDLSKKYNLNDLAKGDVIFAATGVTDGSFLGGVKLVNNGAYTYSISMESKCGTIRKIETFHNIKPHF
jgi:fructose-1,6-bisphosphatase II / sedoheptulose-1,7-bisphosphatase